MKKIITMLVVSLGATLHCHADTGLTLYDNATNYMQLKSPAAYSAPYRLKMPLAAPTTGQVMAATSVAGSTSTMMFVDMAAYAGSVGVSSSGVVLSTAVKRIDLNGQQFAETLAGTTAQIALNGSSVTLQGNRYSLSGIAASTGTLTTGLYNTGVATGTLQTQITATGVTTGTLAASLFATSSATGTLQTQIASVGVATATLATNFPVSLSTNVVGSLPATSISAGTLGPTVVASSITAASVAPYAGSSNTNWVGYQFPSLIYNSSTTVYASTNAPVGATIESKVLFPDGVMRVNMQTNYGPGYNIRTWQANSTATFTSGSDGSGMLRNEYLTFKASGTFINWLYVASQISTYTFVIVGDTTSYNAATFNIIYGTNSWVYAGTSAWTKNNGDFAALVPFAYEGGFVNYLVNPGTLNGMATFTQGISLIPSTLNPAGGEVAWVYASGQNITSRQMPVQFQTCNMVPGWTFAGSGAEVFVLYVQGNSGGTPGGVCEGYYPGSPTGHASRLQCMSNVTNGFTPLAVTIQSGDRIELDIGGCFDRAMQRTLGIGSFQ